ncbi:hypothetical protein SLS60_010040 [Paraconiothyrium brasiliense]|uniref:Amidohydrolase-related domain-containing protein n=1 Tax=Paraconiothyrium brasiliense TaxID=300254 RepID=A0ABR3QTZ3_9PLEO
MQTITYKKPTYPVVDVWANLPGLGAAIPEVAQLFAYSHSDPKIADRKRSPEDVITMMDEAGVSHICLSAWSRPGKMIFSNAEVAQYTRAYPKRIFGLATVDLHDPVNAVRELEHYVKNEGFVGLRIVPWLWNLPPTDPHYWPLFVKCVELDIPFLTQVGHTAPACPSEVGRPIPYIDTIALKFPDLKIIMGHIGYPWAAETVAVAWKHKNVYIDTSAWSPKYYAPELIKFANTTGKKKVMFGTNFPQLGWKTCIENVQRYLVNTKEGFKDHQIVEDFMGRNALQVLRLPETPRKAYSNL